MTIDDVLWVTGVVTSLFAGALLIGFTIVGLFWLLIEAWKDFSIKFRTVFREEKLILEFKRNRYDFLAWKEEQEGTQK